MKVFITGYLQVTLISLNTYLISKSLIIPAVVVGFFISLLWSFNVGKVALGGMKDKIIYSSGASMGTLTGLLIGGLLWN